MQMKGKKALVMGLGLHGGGVATVRYLLRRGAEVTVTDLKTESELAPSLQEFSGMSGIQFALGGHREDDFACADIVVVNPGVPRQSPFLAIAREYKKAIVNDASLFFMENRRPVIAVTGTRGKTTTTEWIASLLSQKYPGVRPSGNIPENPLLSEIEREVSPETPVICELSSWQLEFLPVPGRALKIAAITNLRADHLNRYDNMESYASAKANIFGGQDGSDALILSAHDEWTPFFLEKKPKSRVYFVSAGNFQAGDNGIYISDGYALFSEDGKVERLVHIGAFGSARGEHNASNLLFALLAARLFDPDTVFSEEAIASLPGVRFREQTILNRGGLSVVNDSCATSPDATIAAIRRFVSKGELILIVGGTDKNLDYRELAEEIGRSVKPDNLFLLNGSATKKLARELESMGYAKKLNIYEELKDAAGAAFERAHLFPDVLPKIILFSPGAASFEKFKHEFDRGEWFSEVVKEIVAVDREAI